MIFGGLQQKKFEGADFFDLKKSGWLAAFFSLRKKGRERYFFPGLAGEGGGLELV